MANITFLLNFYPHSWDFLPKRFQITPPYVLLPGPNVFSCFILFYFCRWNTAIVYGRKDWLLLFSWVHVLHCGLNRSVKKVGYSSILFWKKSVASILFIFTVHTIFLGHVSNCSLPQGSWAPFLFLHPSNLM